jgi:DHA2 family lincomycin resistance protein-like MFS transporter
MALVVVADGADAAAPRVKAVAAVLRRASQIPSPSTCLSVRSSQTAGTEPSFGAFMTPEQYADPASGGLSSRHRLVILLLLASAFVAILNETTMAVALPRLMSDLEISATAAQWLTTAFMLTMAVVIPVTGYLIQRLNTRPVFILAMSLFSLGTLICGLAPDFAVLVAGRVVQASGTAILMPLLMTTIMTLVPAAARGKFMGNISIVISVAPALGPTLSGLILSGLGWRWIFFLILPIALVALLVGARRIENVSVPTKAPMDVASVALAAIGFGAFVYGLSGLGEAAVHAGASSPWPALLGGAAVIGLFVRRQLRLQTQGRALLNLQTLKVETFRTATAVMVLLMMAMLGVFILLPIYLQSVLGLSTLRTGLLLLPGGLIMGLCAPTVGSMYDRFGPRPVVIPGAALFAAVMVALAFVRQDTPVMALLAGHVVLSVGLALMFTPLFTLSLGALPASLYSHGSAVLGTTQQVAGAAGVALFVAVMTWRAGAMTAAGLDEATAIAGGIQAAFACGAVLAIAAFAMAFRLRSSGPPATTHAGG